MAKSKVNTTTTTSSIVLSSSNITPQVAAIDALIPNLMANTGSIGDKVWLDTSPTHDGIGGLAAPGVAGVTVSLYQPGVDYEFGTADDVLIETQITDANGHYQFTNVAEGYYQVLFSNIGADFRFTSQNYSANQDDTSHVDPATGRSNPFYLNPSQQYTNIDAGIRDKLGSISGIQWQDNDGDGYQFDNLFTSYPFPDIYAGMQVKLYQAGADNTFGSADDVLVTTQYTGADGKYTFANLNAGDYQVEFALRDANTVFTSTSNGNEPVEKMFGGQGIFTYSYLVNSDVSLPNGRTATITVADFQDVTQIDAGVTDQDTIIGDRVWEDLNYDGIQNPNEPGIAGVDITLLDNRLNAIATTVTDQWGFYRFQGLSAGDYTVHVNAPADYFATKPGGLYYLSTDAGNSTIDSDGNTPVVSLTQWEKDFTQDAGLYRKIHTSGLAWNDVNQNGIQDAGEKGIAGVTVRAVNRYWQEQAATVTDINGNYTLDLKPGEYRLSYQATSGYNYSLAGQGTDPALDSDVYEPSYTQIFTVASGDQPLDFDAGFYQTEQITYQLGDRIWEDANCNGIQDEGEWNNGIANVAVDLLDASGNVLESTVSDDRGYYLFGNLADGAYTIHVNAPAGYHFTIPDQPAIFANSVFDSSGNSKLLNLSAGDFGYNKDAGLYRNGTISSTVWNDQNQNGIQEDGENGMAGVTVKLVDISQYSTFIKSAVTDANGRYTFDDVGLGNYSVKVFAPAGYEYTQALAGTDPMVDSNVDDKGFSTPINNWISNFQALDVGAGLVYNPEKPSVQDRIWNDQNQNGIQDAGENGMANVTVNLLNASAANNLLQSVVTDANGYYAFDNVDFGNYTVQVIAPTGFNFTQMQIDSDSGLYTDVDSDVNYNGYSSYINAWHYAGEALNVDAGLYDSSQKTTIGDRVWEDANCNGIQDLGEWNKGLFAATVELQKADGSVVATTLTDGDGHYAFNNVDPGTYRIHVTPQPGYGYTPTVANQNGGDLGHSAIDSESNTALFTVAAGDKYVAADAGFYAKASFGDLVWDDANQNGLQDADESGIAGVTVNLLDASVANNFIRSVQTDNNGHYEFTDVDLGNYTLQVVAPEGYTYTQALVGTDTNIDSSVDSNGETVPINVWISAIKNVSLDAGLIQTPAVNSATDVISLLQSGTQPSLSQASPTPTDVGAVNYDIPSITVVGSPDLVYA